MARYRMQWIERMPHWCHVEADSPTDAKKKFLEGDIIEGTLDCDPGYRDNRTITVELVEEMPKFTFMRRVDRKNGEI